MGPTIIIHQMPDGIVHLMCSLCNARTTYLPNDKATFDLFRSEHLHEGLEAPLVVQKKVAKGMKEFVTESVVDKKDAWISLQFEVSIPHLGCIDNHKHEVPSWDNVKTFVHDQKETFKNDVHYRLALGVSKPSQIELPEVVGRRFRGVK